jgi:hypothetical protein
VQDGAEKLIKRRKRGLKKDPKAPKKALSAFVFFGQAQRPKLLKKNPNMSFVAVGAELGKLWQKLSDSNKEPYNKEAAADKERFEKEMKRYTPDPEYLKQVALQKTKRLKKDPARPKRSRSAYLVFCDIHRPALQKKHGDKKMTEVAGLLAEMWGKVSKKEREACEKTAAKEKVVYEKALKNYTPSDEYLKAKESVQNARKQEAENSSEAKAKKKEKIAKQKARVKELQADVKKCEKAIKDAEKAQTKLAGLQEDLDKTEAKLAELKA